MPAPSIRVLLAEDYPPFRRFLASTMQNRPELQIICEVEDGPEAVRQAAALQPQVVLLDIGLPRLNGIEAARQIRNISPKSKILFVSQESSADIVQAALETGAKGYVVKTDAGRELIPALEAVLREQTYVSKSLWGYGLTNVPDRSASHVLEMGYGLESCRQLGLQSPRQHEVGFYSDDRSLLDGYTRFVGAVLKTGNAAIVVATELHRQTLLTRLQADGLDMSAAIEQGRYIALDDAETIATFMVNDLPDAAQFSKVTGDLIARTANSVQGEHARVAACGECAPRLWDRGNTEGAVRLERLWDEIARSYGVQVFCGYRLGSFEGGTGRYTYERICAEHSCVLS
ncbi:MAG: response regulator transcription factor [Candidatus Sulfotelmatobacter sp.]